jgi:hypothetical protein
MSIDPNRRRTETTETNLENIDRVIFGHKPLLQDTTKIILTGWEFYSTPPALARAGEGGEVRGVAHFTARRIDSARIFVFQVT